MIGSMIGLDTNVLVRYLTQDDPAQAAHATRVVEKELSENTPGFIGQVVLVETVWVLQRLYGASAQEIRECVSDLLSSRNIVVENREVVARALTVGEENACSLTDALITAAALIAGCSKTLTFDRGAVRAGMTLIE
jgi:predicted nucleic-acid-binding protein